MLRQILSDYLNRCQQSSLAGRFTETVNTIDEMREYLRQSPPDPSEVLQLLQEISSNIDIPYASHVFVAAWFNLSTEYVPALCQIVMSEQLAGWHEQAIELLGELKSPAGVPALKKSLDYRWDYDEWLCVPRKALQALYAIGTDEALGIVRQGTRSDVPEIREEAEQLLDSAP